MRGGVPPASICSRRSARLRHVVLCRRWLRRIWVRQLPERFYALRITQLLNTMTHCQGSSFLS